MWSGVWRPTFVQNDTDATKNVTIRGQENWCWRWTTCVAVQNVHNGTPYHPIHLTGNSWWNMFTYMCQCKERQGTYIQFSGSYVLPIHHFWGSIHIVSPPPSTPVKRMPSWHILVPIFFPTAHSVTRNASATTPPFQNRYSHHFTTTPHGCWKSGFRQEAATKCYKYLIFHSSSPFVWLSKRPRTRLVLASAWSPHGDPRIFAFQALSAHASAKVRLWIGEW